MANNSKEYRKFCDLTEQDKDEIINWVIISSRPLSDAVDEFNVSISSINRIFKTRYKPKNTFK